MAVRICAFSVPRFYDGGIEVGTGWISLPKSLKPEQRASLIEHVGRFVQVHPEDVTNLSEYGLALVDGKISEVKTTKKTGGKTAENEG